MTKWYKDQSKTEQIAKSYCRSLHINAEQFLSDAELLLKNNSYGHAYSLAVLAFEEWSKWWQGVGLFMGLIKYDKDNFASSQKNHISKQLYSLQVILSLLFTEWYEITLKKNEFNDIINRYFKGDISEIRFNELLLNILKSDDNIEKVILLEFIDKFTEYEQNPNKMEKKKQRGFYVEINSKKEGVFDPNQILKSEVEPFLVTVKQL